MRRRVPPLVHEPPGPLLVFDLAEWLPLVDPGGYDPEAYRNRGPGGPYGPPVLSAENWRRGKAWGLWSQARLDWCDRYGWPGGLGVVDLLRQQVAARRADRWRSDA